MVNGLQPITIKQPIVLFLLFVKHVTPQPRYYVCSLPWSLLSKVFAADLDRVDRKFHLPQKRVNLYRFRAESDPEAYRNGFISMERLGVFLLRGLASAS